MNLKQFYDNTTTVLLACVPLALLIISYFHAYIPPEYIALVTIVLALLSQYSSNQRVKDSVEIVKKWIRWDYITTILLAVWPIIVAFQPQILTYVPPAFLAIVTAIFALISQYVADKREENSSEEDA